MSAQEALRHEPGDGGDSVDWSEHSATPGALKGPGAEPGNTERSNEEADVDVRVERRVRRLAALFRQAAQIVESLAQDVQNQLAVSREPRHMEPVPKAVSNTVESNNADPKKPHPLALIGAPELAQLLAVDVATIRRWRRAGELPPAVEIGGTVRWRPNTIETWLREREATS